MKRDFSKKKITTINYTRQESVNRMFAEMRNRRPNSKKPKTRAKKSQERSVSRDRQIRREEKKRVPKINLTLKNKAKKLGHSKSRPVLKLNAEI